MSNRVIMLLFPVDKINVVSRNRSKDLEVNGLPKGFIPQNCEVLLQGREVHGDIQRMHYLVNVDNRVAYLTVCQPEFGDSWFALIRCMAQINSEEAEDVEKYAKTSITMMCAPQ